MKNGKRNINALAELAELLNSPVELMPGTGNSLVGLNREQLEAYKKAQRIVAELAKVRVTHHDTACIADCINGYFNCREIAEEGETK